MVALPGNLAVGADYGMTVINGAPPPAQTLAELILSASGRGILARYGFAPPAVELPVSKPENASNRGLSG